MPEDVIPEEPSPSPDPTPEPEPAPEPSPVSDAQPQQGRTIDNVHGEMTRRFGSLEQQISMLVAAMQQQRQPEPAPAGGWDKYSDEQLGQLAQSGSTEAQTVLTERISARQVNTALAAQQQQFAEAAELNGLYQRYPQLQNANDPLTQLAMRYKFALMQQGAHPQRKATDVEAIRRAIADQPQLAAAQPPTQPQPRRQDPSPQQSVDGATQRRSAPQPNRGPKLDPKARAIAERMGLKDPEGAIKRMQERNEKGQSGLSPTVAMIIERQGNA